MTATTIGIATTREEGHRSHTSKPASSNSINRMFILTHAIILLFCASVIDAASRGCISWAPSSTTVSPLGAATAGRRSATFFRRRRTSSSAAWLGVGGIKQHQQSGRSCGCCFISQSSTTIIQSRRMNSDSSPIIASLFFKDLWKRRPNKRYRSILSPVVSSNSNGNNGKGMLPSMKDAPTSPAYIDTLSMEEEEEEEGLSDNDAILKNGQVLVPNKNVDPMNPLSILHHDQKQKQKDNDDIDDANQEDSTVSLPTSDKGTETATNDVITEEGDDDINNNSVEEDDTQSKKILIHTYHHNNATTTTPTYIATATPAKATSAIINKIFNNNNNVHNNNNHHQNLSLMGVGMPTRQFASWVQYYLTHMSMDGEVLQLSSAIPQNNASYDVLNEITNRISTKEVDHESDEWNNNNDDNDESSLISTLRRYWKDGKLLCEHTNLLSGRNNRQNANNANANNNNAKGELSDEEKDANEEQEEELSEEEIQEQERQYKSEQFKDILGSYADRLASIVEDEMSDVNFLSSSTSSSGVVDNGTSVDNEAQKKPLLNFGQVVDLPDRTKTEGDNMLGSRDGFKEATGDHQTSLQQLQLPKWNTQHGLRGWIEHEYGIENTQLLLAHKLLKKTEKEQLETFQTFLNWFRDKFPYFHDKCDFCGASCKDDPAPTQPDLVATDTTNTTTNGAELNVEVECNGDEVIQPTSEEQQNEPSEINDEEEDNDFSFLGYVYPTPSERLGNASRTELYRCRSCLSYTRFPRYNKALWVTSTQRGRCGEYSMLLYRMLRVLGYDKLRWVVDWADHVWVEVWLGDMVHHHDGEETRSGSSNNESNGRWVHLDPCEAAVDLPLLYESWGKNQTYIVAFHDPFYSSSNDAREELVVKSDVGTMTAHATKQSVSEISSPAKESPEKSKSEIVTHGAHRFPPVEDITHKYTSDKAHVIQERRGIPDEPVADAIGEVSKGMVHLLQKMMQQQQP